GVAVDTAHRSSRRGTVATEICQIATPLAEQGRGRAAAEAARSALVEAGARVELRFTRAAGEARAMAAAAAAEGFERIAAVGGDGSISDVAAGLAGTQAAL